MYVIRLPDRTTTSATYTTEGKAIAALARRTEVGAKVWWCKYGREAKVLVATLTDNGVAMYDPMMDLPSVATSA